MRRQDLYLPLLPPEMPDRPERTDGVQGRKPGSVALNSIGCQGPHKRDRDRPFKSRPPLAEESACSFLGWGLGVKSQRGAADWEYKQIQGGLIHIPG